MFNSVTWMQTSQSSFWECSCLHFIWGYSRFQRNPQSYPNIHLQILQKACFQPAPSNEMFSSVSWGHTSHTSFCERFCLVFMGRYFFFHGRHQSAPNVQIQIQQKVFQSCTMKGNVQICDLNADITKQFLRMFLSTFYMKIFPFPTKSTKLSKYPLADSTKTVFPTCSIKRNVQLC